MRVYRTKGAISSRGTLTIRGVPFQPGDTVEVIVIARPHGQTSTKRPALRDKPVRYAEPLEGVVGVGLEEVAVSDSVVTQVLEKLVGLPDNLQQQVLGFVEALSTSAHRGVPGQRLLRFAGAFPADALQGMQAAIEAGCEQVDAHEW